ncbi:MAG: sigma-54-dependent Fis family transcriptional regulator [Candidatus Omnitrophica bacterium]|jgi:DNA-binding NtrC family response regulator|nr:sigma-54-dependent Fis family transcriptional regulator [Candidatus Omnitrophota bacterium]
MSNKGHILIVDDEPLTRKSLFEILKFQGYKVSTSADGEEAYGIIEQECPDILITDLKMPKVDGLALLKKTKEISPDTTVILITAYGSIENAVSAMREGAFDYITKPIIDSEIKIIIQRVFEQKKILEENKLLKKQIAATSRDSFFNIIGANHKMQRIYGLIETVAPTNATVLIQGESGTGKRLIAQAIWKSDPVRKDKPFVEVSCGALPETLLESELFGHIKDAFTSAIKDRQGRFETADKGTIFLDEIDTFSPKLQVKLLRVLQEGEFERVGDSQTQRVDVRVIAATNQDLKKLINEGTFREDLYYRLNVIPIYIPCLRERKDDIIILAEHFLEKCSQKIKNKKVEKLSEEVKEIFLSYDWPGNVRELENAIERAVIISKGSVIEKEHLPEFLQNIKTVNVTCKENQSLSLKEALKSSEKKIIEEALKESQGNRKKVAETLGINRTTLYNKMREYGLLDEED